MCGNCKNKNAPLSQVALRYVEILVTCIFKELQMTKWGVDALFLCIPH